jgi:dolichyl-phosphate beta-glucosyltransferase
MPLREVRGCLIVPCFNEEHRWDDLYHQELLKIMSRCNIGVIYINDGSTDKTSQLIKGLKVSEHFEDLHLSSNQGKGNAIRMGLLHAVRSFPSAEFFGYVDSDGAFSLKDISNACKYFMQTSDDVLIGARVQLAGSQVERTPIRHIVGRSIATLLNVLILETTIYDPQSGLKIIRKSDHFQESISNSFATKWFFDCELLLRMNAFGKHEIQTREFALTSWKEVEAGHLKWHHGLHIIKELVSLLVIKLLLRKQFRN